MNNKLIKDKVNFEQIKQIKAFAELGATKKLFELFWAGQYIRIIDNAIDEYSHVLPFEKSTKIGATSWVIGRHVENIAYLVYSIYKVVAPDNCSLERSPTPEELSILTSIYNIKYHSNSPLIITKVYSLLNGLTKNKLDPPQVSPKKLSGIGFHKCRCGNEFIARCSTVTASCQWCRSKIKKVAFNEEVKHVPSAINIQSISLMTPNSTQT